MQYPRFVLAKPFITLAVAIAAWMVLPSAAKRVARLTFFEFQAPADVGAEMMRNMQDYWAMRSRGKNDLIEAGKELARLNALYARTAEIVNTHVKETWRVSETR